jgi:hypothetical protein
MECLLPRTLQLLEIRGGPSHYVAEGVMAVTFRKAGSRIATKITAVKHWHFELASKTASMPLFSQTLNICLQYPPQKVNYNDMRQG